MVQRPVHPFPPVDPFRRHAQRTMATLALAAAFVATAGTVAVSLGTEPIERLVRESSASAAEPDGRERPPRAAGENVTIGWVGDTVLGSRHGLPPEQGRELLRDVRALTRQPDVMIGNLEGTFSVGGAAKCGAGAENCFAFQAPPANARTLRWAGFDVMSLANNHAFDFGAQGQAQTVAALTEAGVAHTGTPGLIHVREVEGLKVAVVGFAPYPWAPGLADLDAARALVRQAAQDADLVVVTMHAGAEGADQTRTPVGTETAFGEDRGDTRAFAHAVVDAGADLVLGSGPHVIRGMERYKGRLIAYSLGNFAGFNNFSTSGVMALSGLLRVTLRPDGTPRSGRWHALRLEGAGAPARDATGESARLAGTLSREDFGTVGVTVRDDGRLALGR